MAITAGPVFRRFYRGDSVGEGEQKRLSAQTVALVVKALAERAGLDPTRYAVHSLRRGLLTSVARRRASIWKMAAQSRHKSIEMVREYIEDA